MGARRQVVLYEGKEKDPFLYVYSHWGGADLEGEVARGLFRGRPRWDDSSYLARILVSELVRSDIDGLTGFGLSGEPFGGLQYEDIEIYLATRRVCIDDEVWDFDEFVGQKLPKDFSLGQA
jgi:hypothetical protein